MTSRRKLDEEIARTQDPSVRKQLQELLDKREQRRDKTIKDAKEIGASLLHEIDAAAPSFTAFGLIMCIGSAILLVVFFVVIFLGWVF